MILDSHKKKPLDDVVHRLKQANVSFTLGGSAMLAFYGCKTPINDWDITTDAEKELVEKALEGFEVNEIKPGGIFASKYLFQVHFPNISIDIIGNFALNTKNGIHEVPTVAAAEWDGIPINDPHPWIKAYEILGRKNKADILRAVLN